MAHKKKFHFSNLFLVEARYAPSLSILSFHPLSFLPDTGVKAWQRKYFIKPIPTAHFY